MVNDIDTKRRNKIHIGNSDLKVAKLIFEEFIKKKATLFVGFTGLLLTLETYPLIIKLLKNTSKLVVTPCAVYKEIESFQPNLNEFSNKKMSVSSFLKELGKLINNKDSFLFTAYRNDVTVYMPIIEGNLAKELIKINIKLDVIADIKELNRYALFCESKTACLILGIGLVKHHILNANLFREGADYTILVNTAVEFDGSDAGAELEEAKSWGKFKMNGVGIKIRACPTLILKELMENVL